MESLRSLLNKIFIDSFIIFRLPSYVYTYLLLIKTICTYTVPLSSDFAEKIMREIETNTIYKNLAKNKISVFQNMQQYLSHLPIYSKIL
jgi:hypothetical protein